MNNFKKVTFALGLALGVTLFWHVAVPRLTPVAAARMARTPELKSPASLFDEAKQLVAAGRQEEAIAKIQNQFQSLDATADKARAHEILGDLGPIRSGFDWTNVVNHYDSALLLSPNVGRLHFKKASLMFSNPDFHPRGIAELEKCLALGFTNAETFYLLGSFSKFAAEASTNSQQTLKYFLTAMEHYQQALRIDPNHAASIGNSADIAFNFQNYTSATRLYENLLNLKLDERVKIVTMTRLAHTQTRLGNFDRAAVLLDQTQLEFERASLPENPAGAASFQVEGVRILMCKVENSLAAGKPSDVITPCEAIRATVAALKQRFTSPQLQHWDQTASELLDKYRH